MQIKRILSLILPVFLLSASACARADGEKAGTLQEFAALAEEHTALLEASFSVPCTWTLSEELKQHSSVGKKTTLLSEIMLRAGCGPYSVAWYDDHVLLAEVSYYPGWEILRRYEAGETALLSPREIQVLEEALALVSGAAGTDLERERYIFDTLCARVTYETADDGSGDKDCAVGALLNGRADCDGYADAMVLCCGLAGIPCRYIHGASTIPSRQGEGDGSHMWNLVYISGSWLMCDATWADQDRAEPCYLYFNLGRRDASLSYHWNTGTQFSDISPETDFSTQLMPDQQPVLVYTRVDVWLAARAASLAGKRHLTLYCPEDVLWQTDPDTFLRMLYHGAIGPHSFSESGRLYALSDIRLPDTPFCFCDKEEDILTAIRGYADTDTRTFTLFLAPGLGDRLLAGEHEELSRILALSCLAETGGYRYSTESGSVTLADVSFIDPLPVCAGAEDVIALLNRELPAQPASLGFVLTDGLTLESIKDRINTAIYSLGVTRFSYTWSGSRITIEDLVYHSNYCMAETEEDVLAWMIRTRENGLSELQVYCTDALYASLHGNSASGFFTLLQKAGFTSYSVYSSDEYRLMMADGLK